MTTTAEPTILWGGPIDRTRQQTAHRRLNVGCGEFPLLYWTNLDESPTAIADRYVRVPPLPYPDAAFDDIYAGHFLEHLSQADASAFLRECHRCLAPEGRLGILVPDTREILTRYLRGDVDEIEIPGQRYRKIRDLNAVCELFLYSTVQDSPHLWSYDTVTLTALLESCGFRVTGEFDRYHDPRVAMGAWYQVGLDSVKASI